MLSKNYVYQLIIKFNTIDKTTSTSRLITKKQYDSD